MTSMIASKKRQAGVFIVEALVSVLILMAGMIALVGVASQSINQAAQTKYRNDASYLAGELIGEMWITAGTPTNFTASAAYTAWQSRVTAALPGGVGTATPVAGTTQVAIDVAWADKKDPGVTHHYQTSAQIAKN